MTTRSLALFRELTAKEQGNPWQCKLSFDGAKTDQYRIYRKLSCD